MHDSEDLFDYWRGSNVGSPHLGTISDSDHSCDRDEKETLWEILALMIW